MQLSSRPGLLNYLPQTRRGKYFQFRFTQEDGTDSVPDREL